MGNKTCHPCAQTRRYLHTFDDILATMMKQMTQAPLGESISQNFIAQMIPHHRAAIAMSCNLLEYPTNPALRMIAGRIIVEQTRSIANMQRIESCCARLINLPEDVCAYQRQTDAILQTMFMDMSQACADDRISCEFMREMIPHHEGAIEMAQTALQYEICSPLKPILCAIVASQEQGVRQMRRLLRRREC